MGAVKLFLSQCSFITFTNSSLLKTVLCRRFNFPSSYALSTCVKYKMGYAYFRCSEDSETVHISITHHENNQAYMVNFARPLLENVKTFLDRVEIKLQAIVSRKLKRKSTEEVAPEIKACLLINNEMVSGELKFQDIFKNNSNGELMLKINNMDYDVVLNAPTVLKIALAKKIFASTIAFPETFETQFMDEEKSEYIWYKSKIPIKLKSWEKCGEGFFYYVKEEDIGYHLKLLCTPKKNDLVGPVIELVSDSEVFEFNALKEIKKRHEFTKNVTNADEFRIVCYNILAHTYTQTKEAKTQLFTFCDPNYLNFSYRKTLCMSELLGYNADIICLQEVDKYYQSILQLFFSKRDYECFYHEKEGTKEGCLFIYNRKKFNIISINQYIFSKELFNNPLLNDIKVKIQENEKLATRFLGIGSQIQVAVLESYSKNILIIGNTHFYFHPDADHIRLLQGVLSWQILQNIYEEIKKKQPDKNCSILLCGDLNSTPECGFHQLLTAGFVDADHISWKSKEDEEINNLCCQHSFKMKSAYDNTQFTNYTPIFKGCLDYIYYETDHLKLLQTVPIPSDEVLNSFFGIPSEFFPSDHVALIADLKFNE